LPTNDPLSSLTTITTDTQGITREIVVPTTSPGEMLGLPSGNPGGSANGETAIPATTWNGGQSTAYTWGTDGSSTPVSTMPLSFGGVVSTSYSVGADGLSTPVPSASGITTITYGPDGEPTPTVVPVTVGGHESPSDVSGTDGRPTRPSQPTGAINPNDPALQFHTKNATAVSPTGAPFDPAHPWSNSTIFSSSLSSSLSSSVSSSQYPNQPSKIEAHQDSPLGPDAQSAVTDTPTSSVPGETPAASSDGMSYL
jgi:hypothetical protein